MGTLRTLLLCLGLAAAALPLRAQTLSPEDLARLFATCAGRYSAETEHLWSVDGPASDEAAQRRDLFIGLADAAGHDARTVLGWRVSAKAVQRQLLDMATYGGGARAARAGEVALRERTACDGLLLGH